MLRLFSKVLKARLLQEANFEAEQVSKDVIRLDQLMKTDVQQTSGGSDNVFMDYTQCFEVVNESEAR